MEWRAHTTQIRCIKADAERHQQEVLLTTNVIQDAIEKNNVIFAEKWEATHDCIDRRLEEVLLLKNRVVDLEALSGLQQTVLQSCQNTIVLNRGSAYSLYNVNRIPLTSAPMPAALLSDPMIRLTPIFDIGAVFRI